MSAVVILHATSSSDLPEKRFVLVGGVVFIEETSLEEGDWQRLLGDTLVCVCDISKAVLDG